MKSFLNASVVLFSIMFSVSATALTERELSCWELNAVKGSQPLVKAQIIDNVTIESVVFNFQKDGPWREYRGLQPSPEDIVGAEIVDSHSPYNGSNEYELYLGRDIFFRWILPANLGAKTLKDFRFPNKSDKRMNSMILSPRSAAQSEGRNDFTPLYCESK